MKKLVDTPNALVCHLCGKHIDPDEYYVQCKNTSYVYCSRRCYYYDFLQIEKETDPIYAYLDSILEKHCSNVEQKMDLLEALNEITNAILSIYGVYWFLPEVYTSNKWSIYIMFKSFNVTSINLDLLALDLYQMRNVGICG